MAKSYLTKKKELVTLLSSPEIDRTYFQKYLNEFEALVHNEARRAILSKIGDSYCDGYCWLFRTIDEKTGREKRITS